MDQTEALPDAEALLLDSLRAAAWSPAPRHAAGLVLAARGTAAAAPLVAALAGSAASAALRPPLCPQLGDEEALLLAAVALAQRGGRREALALLCRALPPLDAYRATAQAVAIGAAFRSAGLGFGCPWRAGVPGFRRR